VIKRSKRRERPKLSPRVRAPRKAKTMPRDTGAAVDIDRLRSAWSAGDWEGLADVDVPGLADHPQRHLVALLTAAAQQQLGRHEQARHNVRLAICWGCPRRVLADILMASVHNTLGRAAALTQDSERMQRHFAAAVLPGAPDSGTPLTSQVRSLREMRRLNLLDQAAGVLGAAIAETRNASDRAGHLDARIKVLESELGLLSEELSLAHQRQVLTHVEITGAVASDQPGSGRSPQALRNRSASQLGQDLWVLEMSAYKRSGFFVEFGATDGVLLSNSYLLEREFGWSGLCAEPNPQLFAQLQRNRRCVVSDACIAGISGQQVDFVFAGAFGGMAKYCSADQHGERRAVYAAAGQVGVVSTISLDDFLRKHGAPHDIDYLSIDTEGSEFEILSNFPFERWNIGLITVEHNHTPQKHAIFELLHRQGYRRIEREWEDWYSRGAR
jgi:FkbM family methyltransferase